MRRLLLLAAVIVAAGLSQPAAAQSRAQLGPLCTGEHTPADRQIAACDKIIALKVFSGAKLAAIYFWRAVGWNKKGDYTRVIADATESLRLSPGQVALYNLRGSAYYDKGEYDIAIADFDDALRLGPPSSIVYHNRGNAWRGKGDYARALADYDQAVRLAPDEAYSWKNRGITKQALGDLDGALADINQAIRLDPALPAPLIARAVIWRAKGELDRAIADAGAAIALARAKTPANIMTPPGSVLIAAHLQRALAYEARGDRAGARADFDVVLAGHAADAGSQANQATARVRVALLAEPPSPSASRASQASRAAPVRAAPVAPAAADLAKPGGARQDRRVALVIGNSAYRSVRALPNAGNDARAIAQALRGLGFEVVEGIDLDTAALRQATDDFMRSAARAQVALLYFAGHGVQIAGRNFLVPVDVQLKGGGNPMQAMVEIDSLLYGLDDQIRTNILILDACRNNPLPRDVASADPVRSIETEAGLAAPTAPASGATRGAGTLIAFATGPGQVAFDGDDGHSPFSAALARHIGTTGLELQQMLTRVRADVVTATHGKQVPWSNSSLLGEVYLGGRP